MRCSSFFSFFEPFFVDLLHTWAGEISFHRAQRLASQVFGLSLGHFGYVDFGVHAAPPFYDTFCLFSGDSRASMMPCMRPSINRLSASRSERQAGRVSFMSFSDTIAFTSVSVFTFYTICGNIVPKGRDYKWIKIMDLDSIPAV